MRNKIEYPELRNSVIKGCDDYLYEVKSGIDLAGYYHGEQGRIRALKAKEYASKISNNSAEDHTLLLALLYAVFDSTSKGLAMCIAMRLIQGKMAIVGAYQNDYLSEPVITDNTLKSPAFSQEMVDAAACENLIATEDSPFGPVLEPDKKQCVRWILNHQAPNGGFFKHLTQHFKADLDNAKSTEIDATMLDHSLACF